MDFGVVGGFDSSSILCSNSNSNVSFSLDGNNNSSDEAHTVKRSAAINEDYGGEDDDAVFREFKAAKTNNPSSAFQRSNNVGEGYNQQMLSFSSQNPTTALPLYYSHRPLSAFGLNGANMQGMLSRVRAPFTPSQWLELEHQAAIYKYIIDNVPVPPHLLNPIRKAFESSPFSCYSAAFRSNPLLGWGGVHLGFSSSTDPEPGRCRRTDGKKWRCSRDAVGDQKYCERHMNRGRHRSRKPVEAAGNQGTHQTSNRKPTSSEPSKAAAAAAYPSLTGLTTRTLSDKDDQQKAEASPPAFSIGKHNQNPFGEASINGEFGFVCSDSLLNPLNPTSSLAALGNLSNHEDEDKSKHFLRQFVDDWPKTRHTHHLSDFMSSSTSSPTVSHEQLDMGLSVGITTKVPWGASIGGPLGEVLHANNIDECKNMMMPEGCSLDLTVRNWDNGGSNNNAAANGYLASSSSSPTGVLQRPELNSVSNSSAASSPRGESGRALDANSVCCNNGSSIFGRGIV